MENRVTRQSVVFADLDQEFQLSRHDKRCGERRNAFFGVLSLDLECCKKIGPILFSGTGSRPVFTKKNSHASPTPYFDGERIFVHFGNLGNSMLVLAGQGHLEKRY